MTLTQVPNLARRKLAQYLVCARNILDVVVRRVGNKLINRCITQSNKKEQKESQKEDFKPVYYARLQDASRSSNVLFCVCTRTKVSRD